MTLTLKGQVPCSDAFWASEFSCGVMMGEPRGPSSSEVLCFHDPEGSGNHVFIFPEPCLSRCAHGRPESESPEVTGSGEVKRQAEETAL